MSDGWSNQYAVEVVESLDHVDMVSSELVCVALRNSEAAINSGFERHRELRAENKKLRKHLNTVLAERDELAAIVQDLAESNPWLDQEMTNGPIYWMCQHCANDAPMEDKRMWETESSTDLLLTDHGDHCPWRRARVWSEGQQQCAALNPVLGEPEYEYQAQFWMDDHPRGAQWNSVTGNVRRTEAWALADIGPESDWEGTETRVVRRLVGSWEAPE